MYSLIKGSLGSLGNAPCQAGGEEDARLVAAAVRPKVWVI